MAATVSRGARRYVLVGAMFLVLWGAAALVGAPRGVRVTLGLYGFVGHTLFGKAVSLVPSYFERELAFPRAPGLALPLTALGVLGLTAGDWWRLPTAGRLGSLTFGAGVAVVVGALAWTVRDNLTGGETGTGTSQAARRRVDRFANAVVPLALGYLLVGAASTVALRVGLPTPFASQAAVSHLLAAGGAVLLLFGVGFRLLPRFLVARPPWPLVPVVLGAGAVGPLLLAVGVPVGPTLRAGAVLESAAVVAFALALSVTVARSDRRRVGLWGVLVASWFGVLGVGLGSTMAFGGLSAPLTAAHLRVNLLGFLGLAIVGSSYQFYPPSVGTAPIATDRTAVGVLTALSVGILLEVGGRLTGRPSAVTLGALLVLLGAVTHTWLLGSLFRERYGGR